MVCSRISASSVVTAAVLATVLAAPSQPAADSSANAAQAPVYELPQPPLVYLSPFPMVRLVGRITRTGSRIKLLRVNSPTGSLVTVRCRGGRRLRCPFGSRVKLSPLSRVVRFRQIERPLRAGALIEVLVRDTDKIGKYTSFKIRKRKAPRRTDSCVLPGADKPATCP